MAYQRLQVSEGLAVIPSDTVPIPDPATLAVSGSTTSGVTNKLVDSGENYHAGDSTKRYRIQHNR